MPITRSMGLLIGMPQDTFAKSVHQEYTLRNVAEDVKTQSRVICRLQATMRFIRQRMGQGKMFGFVVGPDGNGCPFLYHCNQALWKLRLQFKSQSFEGLFGAIIQK